jgi:hypothetical protein
MNARGYRHIDDSVKDEGAARSLLSRAASAHARALPLRRCRSRHAAVRHIELTRCAAHAQSQDAQCARLTLRVKNSATKIENNSKIFDTLKRCERNHFKNGLKENMSVHRSNEACAHRCCSSIVRLLFVFCSSFRLTGQCGRSLHRAIFTRRHERDTSMETPRKCITKQPVSIWLIYPFHSRFFTIFFCLESNALTSRPQRARLDICPGSRLLADPCGSSASTPWTVHDC